MPSFQTPVSGSGTGSAALVSMQTREGKRAR